MREVPITTGRPSATISSSRRSSSRLCSSVLPKPIPGSSRIRSSAIPGGDRERHPLLEERLDVADDIVVVRVVLHRPRAAEHVHQAAVGAAVGDDAGHLGVAPQRGHVVDEGGAGGRARLRRPAAFEVSIESRARLPVRASPSITGSTRRSSLGVHGLGARTRRLAADVEDRRALCLELEAVGDRRRGIEVQAPVGERVGRDVDDAHHAKGPRGFEPRRGGRAALTHPATGRARRRYRRASSSCSRSRLLSTLIRNSQLTIQTRSARAEQHDAGAARRGAPVPEHDRSTTPATAIASGSQTRVMDSATRPVCHRPRSCSVRHVTWLTSPVTSAILVVVS